MAVRSLIQMSGMGRARSGHLVRYDLIFSLTVLGIIILLMLEVAHAGEEHGHAMFVGGLDGFLVPDGAAGLDDGGDAGSGRGVNRVPEGEESVRGHDAALDGLPGLHDAYLGGVHAAHLSGADADEFGTLGIDDGVRLDVLAALPGEEEGFDFFFRGLAFGDAL